MQKSQKCDAESRAQDEWANSFLLRTCFWVLLMLPAAACSHQDVSVRLFDRQFNIDSSGIHHDRYEPIVAPALGAQGMNQGEFLVIESK